MEPGRGVSDRPRRSPAACASTGASRAGAPRLGLPGPAVRVRRFCRRFAVRRQALGGGMSSRLFQQLREDRGLAYSVNAWASPLPTPACSVSTLRPPTATRAVESHALIARECSRDTAQTLDRARARARPAQLEAGLLMGLETAQGQRRPMWRARSRCSGRIVEPTEMLDQLARGRRCERRPRGRRAMLDGPRARSPGRRAARSARREPTSRRSSPSRGPTGA